MIPILYEKTETQFSTHGLGSIPAWIECRVIEERNGDFYLEGSLPVDAANVANLALERIIMAAPAPGKRKQPFRIISLEKSSDGNAVNVKAYHVTYQLTENICKPFSSRYAAAQSVLDAFFNIGTGRIVPQLDSLFVFNSDIVAASPKQVDVVNPRSVRSVLGGSDGSFLDVFGGELEWGRYIWSVDLWASRGRNTNRIIRYGVNLATIDYSTSLESLITGYYGWWRNEDGIFYVDSFYEKPNAEDYQYTRVEAVDLSSEIEPDEGSSYPTQAQMDAAIAAYANGKSSNYPTTSIEISAVPDALQDLYLCDTVTVIHPGYGLMQSAKIVKTVFDPIAERYTALTIGQIKPGIVDTIARLVQKGGIDLASLKPI